MVLSELCIHMQNELDLSLITRNVEMRLYKVELKSCTVTATIDRVKNKQRLGEKACKPDHWQGVNFENISGPQFITKIK